VDTAVSISHMSVDVDHMISFDRYRSSRNGVPKAQSRRNAPGEVAELAVGHRAHGPRPDLGAGDLGFRRTVALEAEVPNRFVKSGALRICDKVDARSCSATVRASPMGTSTPALGSW
jgi:hypothetical protein